LYPGIQQMGSYMRARLASRIFANSGPDALLICFSHLRWNFVFQRPQHLLTRASTTHNVIYLEEPVFEDVDRATMHIVAPAPRIRVVTPVLPKGTDAEAAVGMQKGLVDELLAAVPFYQRLATWYYTPMALAFSDHIRADVCVYDCMDELTGFKNAPADLAKREAALFQTADLVFTRQSAGFTPGSMLSRAASTLRISTRRATAWRSPPIWPG
jgi:hypothetical protein